MGRRRAAQQGLTLVEMLVTTLVYPAIALMALQMLATKWDAMTFAMFQGDVRTHAHLAVTEMAKELRMGARLPGEVAPSINVPTAPGNTSVTFFVPTDVDGTNGVLDVLGQMEWDTTNPITYQYDAALRQVLRTEGGATRVIANDVTAVAFQDQAIDAGLQADEVRIVMTVQRVTPGGRAARADIAAIVTARN